MEDRQYAPTTTKNKKFLRKSIDLGFWYKMNGKSSEVSIGKKRSISNSDDFADKEDPKKPKGGIQIKLAVSQKTDKSKPAFVATNNKIPAKTPQPPTKPKVASIFTNEDSDDEESEEMPAECRMRMRNIGRDTPTSCGPNSFGKTKYGFCDSSKLFEKNLKLAMDQVSNDNKDDQE